MGKLFFLQGSRGNVSSDYNHDSKDKKNNNWIIIIENILKAVPDRNELNKHSAVCIDHSGKFYVPFEKDINDDQDRYNNINEVKIGDRLGCFRHKLNFVLINYLRKKILLKGWKKGPYLFSIILLKFIK